MINLQQDADGFVRMSRHFPASTSITVAFADGSLEVFTGQKLNSIYDEALANFRSENGLDAKGFSRLPAKTVHPGHAIDFVKLQPGMSR